MGPQCSAARLHCQKREGICRGAVGTSDSSGTDGSLKASWAHELLKMLACWSVVTSVYLHVHHL
jgi:hypothetical protein